MPLSLIRYAAAEIDGQLMRCVVGEALQATACEGCDAAAHSAVASAAAAVAAAALSSDVGDVGCGGRARRPADS